MLSVYNLSLLRYHLVVTSILSHWHPPLTSPHSQEELQRVASWRQRRQSQDKPGTRLLGGGSTIATELASEASGWLHS